MSSILETCQPRPDLLTGSFNPEVFTAILSQVLGYYRGEKGITENIYTDAEAFFTEATYPTQGMKDVLSEVFGRISGDSSIQAIHRLETAFGGGKTHTLIACTHLAHRGTELAGVTGHILDSKLLSAAGEVSVVGIAGDEIPVHKTKGKQLIPYTLWGEIAFQVGGESLYNEVKTEATSMAAPGRPYFDKVFGGRRALVMLDELAQYAARLAAAVDGGADQLAAFLMTLSTYARSHSGLSVVLTLASQKDAFATQTERLVKLLSEVRGTEVSQDEAVAIAGRATAGLQSVVARDATPVTPVQAAEISRVLAKRLFVDIDEQAAEQTAEQFADMYAKSASLLPDEATRSDFKDAMVANYPFHPSLIRFLNNKLAMVETFQGTRGVLRSLAVAVRSIWKDMLAVPIVQTSHLNLRDARIVSEVLSRTGSGDLLSVLNADVGGVDTDKIEGGRSNAELADLRNPHPQKFPMHEWAWRVVFLHSLVGRDEGLQSQLFGLSASQVLFEASFPGLTPPQIQTALDEIAETAFYLRSTDGRYYASLDPSVNVALAKLKRSLANSPKIDTLIDATARKVVRSDMEGFHVVHDVSGPEHIPDKKNSPILSLISIGAGEIDVDACVTTTGENRPRHQQNSVFMLTPNTVRIKGHISGEDTLFSSQQARCEEALKKLKETACTVVAMRALKESPKTYGVNASRLDEQDFDARKSEREQALQTAITQSYGSLWFPSANGQVVRKEIKTAGGESGQSTVTLIRKTLLEANELVTAEHTGQSDLQSLSSLFFSSADTISLHQVRESFYCVRHWPVLETPTVLEQVIRAGVNKGVWCLFWMGSEDNTKPEEFYSRDIGDLPFNLDLSGDRFSIVTTAGANQRGWTKTEKVDAGKVKEWVRQSPAEFNGKTVEDVGELLSEKHGVIAQPELKEAVTELVKDGRMIAFKGKADQTEKPAELYSGSSAILYQPGDDDIVITKAEAAKRGWLTEADQTFSLSGPEGAKAIIPILARLGSLYNRGAKSEIKNLDIVDLEIATGGSLRIEVTDAPPATMKMLGELFEVVAGVAKQGGNTEVFLEIDDPDAECALMKELKQVS